ncbi:MAG TPA: serine hydrolase [Thermoanaerobaculia bacterium]|nr:serine hydrolase [Thermoanaerobaculia bacterium]
MRSRIWPVALLLALAGCSSAANRPGPEPPVTWKQWATPEAAGFDANALEAARSEADRAGSAAVVVVYGGDVLAAWGDVDRKLELHSVRKSLYSALWGIAEAKGLVDLDSTLAALGVDDIQPLTEAEKSARLVDLLRARSGVYHPSAYADASDRSSLPSRGAHSPGTFWHYNNWDFNVAGALLEQVTGQPLGVLFDDWIAKPVGMQDFEPDDVYAVLEPGQSRWPALTFRMSTRDLARFGQLWLDHGRWHERQILPAGWVERASEPASVTGPGQGYGMMWWTYDAGSVGAERYPQVSQNGVVLARGTGGQAIFIIPEQDMVIVHRGDTDHGRGVSGGAIWTTVDRVLAARRSEPSASAALVALDPVPLANQLPELEWPEPLDVDRATLESLAGSYEFGPGMVGRVFIYDGRLFAYMPGEGEAELFAKSQDTFFLRVDPTVGVKFSRDGSRVDRVTITMKGQELVGRRIEK